VYAVVLGLGAGFVGDEVGLLLTFGDCYSTLTFDFLVAAVVAIILIALQMRYWKGIKKDVIDISGRERLIHIRVFLARFSTIFFAFGLFSVGIPLLIGGTLLFAYGPERREWEER
jgi:uncharacterized membrane protein